MLHLSNAPPIKRGGAAMQMRALLRTTKHRSGRQRLVNAGTAITLAATLTVGGVVFTNIAGPAETASAHTGDLTVAVECLPDTGMYKETFTLALANVPEGLTAKVESKTGTTSFQNNWGYSSFTGWATQATAVPVSQTTVTWTATLPGTTTGNGPWEYAFSTWTDGYTVKSDTRAEGLKGDCAAKDAVASVQVGTPTCTAPSPITPTLVNATWGTTPPTSVGPHTVPANAIPGHKFADGSTSKNVTYTVLGALNCPPEQQLTCESVVVNYHHNLTNGDHINLQINPGAKQVHVYVDLNVAGGYNGLGLVFTNLSGTITKVPLTQAQVESGIITFNYPSLLGGLKNFEVTFIQSNSTDINYTFECGPKLVELTVPPKTDKCGVADDFLTKLEDTEFVAFSLIDNDQQKATLKDPAHTAFTDLPSGWVVSDDGSYAIYTAEFDSTPCPVLQVCETLETVNHTSMSDFATSATRSAGRNLLVPNALKVKTIYDAVGSPDPRKAAAYLPRSFDLKDLGLGDNASRMDYTNLDPASFPYGPGGQLLLDADGDPSNNHISFTTGNGVTFTGDAILVVEGVYGSDLWLANESAQYVKDAAPSHVGGSGSTNHGTANQWLTVFPGAKVTGVGYSLGSGVNATGLIHRLGPFGCYQDTFGVPRAPEPLSDKEVTRVTSCEAETAAVTTLWWTITKTWNEDLQEYVAGNKQYSLPVFTTEPLTPEEAAECGLKSGGVQAVCVNDHPMLSFAISAVEGYVIEEGTILRITFVNPADPSESYVVDVDPATTQLPWPGAADPSNPLVLAFPYTWPGYITNADGSFTATTGNFAWTRPSVLVTFDLIPPPSGFAAPATFKMAVGDDEVKLAAVEAEAIQPLHYETVITYPPATSACANPPVTTTTKLGDTGISEADMARYTAMAQIALLGLIAGVSLLAIAGIKRRRNRKATDSL